MKHFIQTLTGKITIVILLIVFPVIFMVYQNGRSTRQNWQEQQITKAEDDLALYASSMDHIFDILEETLLKRTLKYAVLIPTLSASSLSPMSRL